MIPLLTTLALAAPSDAFDPSRYEWDVAGGLAALRDGDCVMCHVIPGIEAPARTGSCVTCHEWVKRVSASPTARAKAMTAFPKWERYEHNVKSYSAVPDLGVSAARLKPSWIVSYLSDPHDLRPSMDETMVRVGLRPDQIQALAEWAMSKQMVCGGGPEPITANLAEGEALFTAKGCPACHTFGAKVPGPGIPAAPDLRYARDRMTDDAILAWIMDPSAVAPGATMPNLGLTTAEAVAIRDWLVLADPGGTPARANQGALPTVSRPVTYDEVEAKVFGKICVHCHMDPAQNEGRAGPGNAGGFGWPATGIELQTYESVRDHGPAILAALLRRRDEAARDFVHPGEFAATITRPEKPGMPLGLPPIPDEDIAIVQAWYAQGAPR